MSWVRQEVADGRLALTEVEKFPQGLGGIYATFFERYFPNPEKYRITHRPILEAICAAREALEVDYLASLFGLDQDYAETELAGAFGSLFPITDGRVRPFHQSLRDWLTDKSRAGATYVTSVRKGHKRLADYGWNQYRNGVAQMERYSVAHLPAHLAACGRNTDLGALLLDFDWMEEKLKETDVMALVSDYDYALVPGATEGPLRVVQRALRRSMEVLAHDESQLAVHLLARIPEQEPLRDRILQRASATPRPWLRPLTASIAGERSIRWLKPTGEEGLSKVAFSSNGQWGAHVSGSFGAEPRNVIVWDLQEWRSCGPRFRALPRLNPFAVTLSDDSRWCLYADSMGGVHRLGDAGEAWEGRAHRDLTIATLLAISADGRRALSACQHGRLVLWDIDADCHEIIWDESDNRPRALSLDATGATAVVAREDGTVHLLDLWPTRDEILCTLPGPPTALARSADNPVVVAAAADGRIEVRSVASPEPAIIVLTTDEQPTSVAVSADARCVAVGTGKGTVEVWSLVLRRRTARYSRAHAYEVKCIAFSHDGAHVISADSLQIKEWAIEATEQQESSFMNSRAVGEVKVTANGQHAVAVLENGRLGVWKLRTGGLESALPPASGPVFGDADVGPAKGIALAANAPRLLAWNEKLISVWDLAAGAGVGSLRVADARDAAITPDGTSIVYVSDMSIILWKPDRGDSEVLGTYEGDPPRHVAISPDAKCTLSSGGDRQVHLWRLDGPSRRQELEKLGREMKRTSQIDPRIIDARFQTRFAPDASYWPDAREKPSTVAFAGPREVIVTTGGGELFVLDLRNKQSDPMRLSDRHAAGVNRVLVHGDGRGFVTSSSDRTIMFWELGKRHSIAVLDAQPGTVERVSASLKRMLLRSADGILKIVSLPDGASLAAFQADKQIISCDADEEIQLVVALDQGGQVHFLCLENGR